MRKIDLDVTICYFDYVDKHDIPSRSMLEKSCTPTILEVRGGGGIYLLHSDIFISVIHPFYGIL